MPNWKHCQGRSRIVFPPGPPPKTKQESMSKKSAGKSAALSAAEFDKKFDAGEDISGHLDLATARVCEPEMQKVNVDFPAWVVTGLDREAARLGIARQALIKVWIAERLERAAATAR